MLSVEKLRFGIRPAEPSLRMATIEAEVRFVSCKMLTEIEAMSNGPAIEHAKIELVSLIWNMIYGELKEPLREALMLARSLEYTHAPDRVDRLVNLLRTLNDLLIPGRPSDNPPAILPHRDDLDDGPRNLSSSLADLAKIRSILDNAE